MGDIADQFSDYGLEEPNPQCKYCGKENLEWEQTPAGWRLFENGKLHNCNDPFEITKEMEREPSKKK